MPLLDAYGSKLPRKPGRLEIKLRKAPLHSFALQRQVLRAVLGAAGQPIG